MKPRLVIAVCVLAAGSWVPAQAQNKPKTGVRLTIYNNNFALVKDRRELDEEFKKGINVIRFRDVAATIDATSVHFRSLTDPGATVIEQNYEFDLVNADKLLTRYIDKTITAFTTDGNRYEGTLLSFDGRQLVLAQDREKGPIFMVERGENIKRIQFSELPEGLLTRPTLVWEIETAKVGRQTVEISYIAKKIRWRADYNLVLGPKDEKMDVSGWVTLQNNSGTAYQDAAVKLLARDPEIDFQRHTFGWGHNYYKTMLSRLAPSEEKGKDPSRAFGEYRMYKLAETTTVNNNQIKQVELINAADVPVTKTYLYDGAKVRWGWNRSYWQPNFGREQNKKVNVLIEIKTERTAIWASPCPKGNAGCTSRTPTAHWSSSGMTSSITPRGTSGWCCISATRSTLSVSASRPTSKIFPLAFSRRNSKSRSETIRKSR